MKKLLNQRYLYPLTIFLTNILIKFYKIESGNFVIWDEAHFGKFSRNYLKRQFYFDVHPPLGKLMTAVSGYLFGQDTDFEFESGSEYPPQMDYTGMRRFHAFISAFVPVLMYGTCRNLGYSKSFSFYSTFFYVFENGNVSISRLILLDSHLLFFTAFVIFFFSLWRQKKSILNISYLGISIGLTLSVKWIGCFTTFFVGVYVIDELYKSLKEEKLSSFFKRFFIRFIFLIIVPVAVYLFWFVVHFKILVHSSSDEANMSSLFQINLIEHKNKKLGKYVDFGRAITIKSNKLSGGNLHSHSTNYPNKNDQQVTIYHHKDDNDNWIIQKIADDEDSPDFLKNNDKVLLLHGQTRKYLSVFGPALISQGKRAGGYSELTQQSVFQVQIEKDIIKNEVYVKTLTTKFRLYSVYEDCYLQPSGKQLPEWGFSQGEVICSKNKNNQSLWNIEKNENFSEKNIHYAEVFNLKFQFFTHFLELNKTMFRVNSSFIQDNDLEPQRIVSSPKEWIFLRRGLRMVSWDDSRKKFYMFGNPFIWLISSICVLISPIVYLFSRKKQKNDSFEFYLCFFGYICHYLPFFFIGRVLYFHHYFPAMLFSTLSIGYVLKRMRNLIPYLILISFITFIIYAPLTYGFYKV
ncbi:hypothetical protein H311_01719, partial [Anncaliia algerae PRA109]